MAGNVKLMTSAGGGVILDTATTTATDVTVKVPVTGVNNGTLVCSDSSGNVGIGTSSPESKLNVASSSDLSITVSKTGVASARIGYDTNGAYVEGVGAAQALGFRAGNAERMRIDSSGNVGIGTTSPSMGLQVQSTAAEAKRTLRIAYDGTYYADFAQLGAGGIAYKTYGGIQHIWVQNDVERMRIDGSGNLQVGGSGQNARIVSFSSTNDLYNGYNGSTKKFAVGNDGQIYAIYTSIASLSDIRTKENIEPIQYGLNQIEQLNPVTFNYIGNAGNTTYGFIAQDVQSVLPELVGEEKDSKAEDGTPYLTLKMGDMLPVLVKAIQELSAKNDALEARITALEAK